MLEIIWNGLLILAVVVIVTVCIAGSWGGGSPPGICHCCGRRAEPPMKHCHNCIPRPNGERDE